MVRAAAIYARISSDPDGSQLGVGRQVEDCRAMAARRDWPVAAVYVDDDLSAYSGRVRPEYERMLADIANRSVDAVLFYHLDRLTRHPRELEAFFDLCDKVGLTALAHVSGDIDLSTHDGRLWARMLGAFARKESDDKSRRIRRKFEELANSPDWVGATGTRPFGFEADWKTANPTEAAHIRDAAARCLAGESLMSLANEWNARNIRTVRGHKWHTTTLRRVLLNPRNAGLKTFRRQTLGPGAQDTILSPDESAQLRALLTDPLRRTSRAPRRYLLTGGLLRCGRCGAAMMGRPRADGQRRYVCDNRPGRPGCGRTHALADPIEDLIAEAILFRLDTPGLADTLRGTSGNEPANIEAMDRLDADKTTLEQLAAAFGQGTISWPEWLAARKPIEARIGAAKRALARSVRSASIADYVGASSALRDLWATLALDRQKAIVAALLDHADVGPGTPGRRIFDPGRITPVWRI